MTKPGNGTAAPSISRPSIPQQAEEILRGMILDGTLAAGERLNEVAIAESVGISRGPLREAIRVLAGQGYLTTETHRGAFVKTYTPQEINDLYELRSALELYSLRLVVKRATDQQLDAFAERMQKEHECITAAGEHSSAKPYVSELDFHQQLAALSGNELICAQLADANHKLFLALRPTKRTQDRTAHSFASHMEVLKKVRGRDENGGIKLLMEHLADSMNNTLNVLGMSVSRGQRTDVQ